ncbi:MAG: hypothetical protein Q9174_002917 [Haloplaca sp. 1 TL-2023]
MPSETTSLDGRTLEGGGQLLRLAVSLSALTYLPVHIWDIRANRAARKPSQPAGGLKPAHLAAVEWLAEATRAETQGMTKGSTELDFTPSQRTLGTAQGQSKPPDHARSKDSQPNVWGDVYEDAELIRKDSHIKLNSPGSVCLILQAILPYLLFHAHETIPRQDRSAATSVPLQITIEGGTNVSKSPSIEYIDQVLIPMLVGKLGIPSMTAKVIKRGWSSGRADVGSVQLDVTPFVPGSKLPAFHFQDRGEVIRMHVSILATDASARDRLRSKVVEKLLARYPEVEIVFPIEEDTNNGARLYLLIVAETSNGYRLGRDCLWDRKTNNATMKTVADNVVKQLGQELERGGCVDEYMQDQLVVFQALAEGRSVVDSGKARHATLHTQTARWVAEQLLGLSFDEQGTCRGCAFEVGENFVERESQLNADPPIDRFDQLKIS